MKLVDCGREGAEVGRPLTQLSQNRMMTLDVFENHPTQSMTSRIREWKARWMVGHAGSHICPEFL